MNDFTENIYYKKAQKIKPRKFIYLFAFFMVLYISQLFFVYEVFIPRVLHNYEKYPEIKVLIKPVLGLLDHMSTFWPIMFCSILGTTIFYTWTIQKMIVSVDSCQKQNRMLSMDSIKDNTYYQRAKKIRLSFYTFLFFLLLIVYIYDFTFAYVTIIPKAVNAYESSQTLAEHIKTTLKMNANLSIFWAIMLFSIIGIMILYIKNTQKLIDVIGKYQNDEFDKKIE